MIIGFNFNFVFEIGPKLAHFLTFMGSIMSKSFDELSAKIDGLTTTAGTIKSEIEALKVAQTQGDMTADEEAQVGAKLDVLTAALADAQAAGAPPSE